MNVYWFDVEVAGPVTDDHAETLGSVMSAGGIDATVQAGPGGGTVMFSREADDAMQAIISAIEDVEAAGMTVTGVTEDLLAVSEIAGRAKVTTASVRYWIAGERGPGGFPGPKLRGRRTSLYSWAEVSAWLDAARLGAVDHVAAETARACALIDAALIVRRGMRELPKHDRPLTLHGRPNPARYIGKHPGGVHMDTVSIVMHSTRRKRLRQASTRCSWPHADRAGHFRRPTRSGVTSRC